MIELSTLEETPVNEILEAFNSSFTNYFVDIHLSLEDLENKIVADGIDLSFSVGAFEEGSLIGFILHGRKREDGLELAYNGGTGVIPSGRGKKLTQRMYDFIIPKFRAEGIRTCYLEVIDENLAAIKSYGASGFKKVRRFECLKGRIHSGAVRDQKLKKLEELDWKTLKSFWDWQPSWQYDVTGVENAINELESIAYYEGTQVVAYLIYNPTTCRVQQFAVSPNYRGRGIGTTLFKYMCAKIQKDIYVINVPAEANETLTFLQKLGLEIVLGQFEMRLDLDS